MTTSSQKHFVVDVMLGKLAKWLRILGCDTRCETFRTLPQLEQLRTQGFTLITRNRKWCGTRGVLCIQANEVLAQLRELFGLVPILQSEVHLLRRCIRCNDLLVEMRREEAFGKVPDYVYETNESFSRCPNCDRVYWQGSHPRRIVEVLKREFGWHPHLFIQHEEAGDG